MKRNDRRKGSRRKDDPVTLRFYFSREKKYLVLTAVTGIIYNVGLTAVPLLEGQLAQYLYDILRGIRQSREIIILSLIYAAAVAAIQTARALKRLYVRKFANSVTLSLKENIFHHLVHESYADIRKEDAGAVMTRAIADAEACAEGMRKFTTEIFDTGVVMAAYIITLLALDWRLTLLVILFPPAAYIASAALKKKVAKSSFDSKEAMSRLNDAAVDNASNALTYRIYGEEKNRSAAYETVLRDYEKKNVAAGVWQNSPQPVYLVISMIGVIPILCFGGRNVLGEGWKVWSIAAFSSFLSCFTRLASKSSHAAKLFNAVQKAQVSWERIRPYLAVPETEEDKNESPQSEESFPAPAELRMEHVSFAYDDGSFSLTDLNFSAAPGDIIGITGRVASGKSTFGRLFLNELPHDGRIMYGGKDLKDGFRPLFCAYSGHDPELFTGTIRDNITFGQTDDRRLKQVLSDVCIDHEVCPDDVAGMEGSELSGGQQARIALARALYSEAPVLILDDPFSAVDIDTEEKIFEALRRNGKNRIILLISHRLEMFPRMDRVLFLENGTMISGSHSSMMKNESYAHLYSCSVRRGRYLPHTYNDSAHAGPEQAGS